MECHLLWRFIISYIVYLCIIISMSTIVICICHVGRLEQCHNLKQAAHYVATKSILTKNKYIELVENTMKLYVTNSCNMSKNGLADIYAPNA